MYYDEYLVFLMKVDNKDTIASDSPMYVKIFIQMLLKATYGLFRIEHSLYVDVHVTRPYLRAHNSLQLHNLVFTVP